MRGVIQLIQLSWYGTRPHKAQSQKVGQSECWSVRHIVLSPQNIQYETKCMNPHRREGTL